MKRVTKIEETKAAQKNTTKLKVAAYCRVSTGNNAQLESLETQKAHYESYIHSRNDWDLAGIYFDDGDIIGLNQKTLHLEVLPIKSYFFTLFLPKPYYPNQI